MQMEQKSGQQSAVAQADVRERILDTASNLFYRRGVRAVGVDLVVEMAGVAKTSLYRHFRTKDDLIAAFLQREDEDFWASWDRVAEANPEDGAAELEGQLVWIGERVGRPHYRGCPQLNVAAEFPDEEHPARIVARRHKQVLYLRLEGISRRMGIQYPELLATQLSVVINGAFVSSQVLSTGDATQTLVQMARALIAATPKIRERSDLASAEGNLARDTKTPEGERGNASVPLQQDILSLIH